MATADECALWRSQFDEKSRFIAVWQERESAASREWEASWRNKDECQRERDAARSDWEGDRDNKDKQYTLANAEEALDRALKRTEVAGDQMREAQETRSKLVWAAQELQFKISSQCSGL